MDRQIRPVEGTFLSSMRALSSVLSSRWNFFREQGLSFDGRRDLYQLLGYPRQISLRQYREEYWRGGIAKRIVDAYPKATWRGGVELYEDEDPNKDTEFEKAFKDLDLRHNFWTKCLKVDILAGQSSYAVLLIGAPGKLSDPLPRANSPKDLLYLQQFIGGGGPTNGRPGNNNQQMWSDADATIQEFDADPASPRFGEPKSYRLKRTDLSSPLLASDVHWTRILHVAQDCLDDNVYGIPTLEPIWNLLQDLQKVTGGGAEAYWLRANQGMHLDVDKDMGLPGGGASLSTTEKAELREKAEEMQHQLQRVLVTRGVEVKQLGSDVANFGQSADAILKQIAGATGIPARILTGSEMGTLASEQDAANFDSQVQDRRTGYAGPLIVRKLIDRLIEYGYLPTPKQPYEVGWPVEENMDEAGKAKFALDLVNVNKTQDAVVFTEAEIRDMAFNKPPLADDDESAGLSESQKAEIAAKLAEANKAMGITLFTDDEIRKITYGFAPLPDDQKVPIGAPERISVTSPPPLGSDGLPVPQATVPGTPAPPEPLATQIKALEAAIASNDTDAIGRILGLAGYALATTQVQLPENFVEFGKQLPKEDLAADGVEDDPHVTLKYGIQSDDPEPVRALLAGRGPITFTLGQTAVFETPDYDVLYVAVQSEDLKRLNTLVGKVLAVTDTQDAYVPHATVAYLKPGLGKKYAGDTTFQGRQHVASKVVFSASTGERTEVPVAAW